MFVGVYGLCVNTIHGFQEGDRLFYYLQFGVGAVYGFVCVHTIYRGMHSLICNFSLGAYVFYGNGLVRLRPRLIRVARTVFSTIYYFRSRSLGPKIGYGVKVALYVTRVFYTNFFCVGLVVSPTEEYFRYYLHVYRDYFCVGFYDAMYSVYVRYFVLPELCHQDASRNSPYYFYVCSTFQGLSHF